MADGKISIDIDADTAAFVQKVVDAGNKMKRSGEDAAGGFGKMRGEIRAAGVDLSFLAAAASGAEKAVAAMADNLRKIGEMNRQAGAKEIQAEDIGKRLGFTNLNDFSNKVRVTTRDGLSTGQDVMGFAGRLADINQDRIRNFKPAISPEQSSKLIDAYRSGGDMVFGKGGASLSGMLSDPRFMYSADTDQLIGRAASENIGEQYTGGPSSAIIARALSRVRDPALRAIAGRKYDARRQESREFYAEGRLGDFQAMVNQQEKDAELYKPGGSAIVRGIPVVGEAAFRGEAAKQAAGQPSEMAAILAELRRQTALAERATAAAEKKAKGTKDLTVGGEEGK